MQKGNNMPIHAPLIPDPFVPYQCKNNKSLFAVCQGNKETIQNYLKATPFEYVDDKFIISVTDFMNCDKVPFMDSAIVIPVKYKDLYGGYYLFEYENNDSAIAAGRDLWGYPKKYAEIILEESDGKVKGTVTRSKQTVIDIVCDLNQPITNLISPTTAPHLNLHVIPKPDGPGIWSKRLISRDTSPDFQKISERLGKAKVTLKGLSTDPLHLLQPIEVIGGGLIVGDFYATEANGWGKVLATLI